MNLIGIESVIFGVEDMPLCTQFWLDFGLKLEKNTTNHVVLSTAEKTTIELKPKDSSDLPKAMIEGSTVRETVWAADTMDSQGWKTHLGPGRHPISSAYFWYFRNPCGGAAEYDFDTDVVTEDWEPRDHESTPESFAEWALESGIKKYKGMQSSSS